MIISVSRRTDIPAFYSSWFFKRLKEGYFFVRNPMNKHQVSKVSLNKNDVDCIVFWTKNPRPMLKRLEKLEGYTYYFQFTLTPYDKFIEPNVPSKKAIIKTFKELSSTIGKERVIWRYDPIILSDIYTKEYHYKQFDMLCRELKDYTNKCIISFLDMYKKTVNNMKEIDIKPIREFKMIEIAKEFSKIAKKYGIRLESCCEDIDLSEFNIPHGKCIDSNLISKLAGYKIDITKDKNQREICGCAKSVDMGEYNTCQHGCKYCYANFDKKVVMEKKKFYKWDSLLLIGDPEDRDTIYERKEVRDTDKQYNFKI